MTQDLRRRVHQEVVVHRACEIHMSRHLVERHGTLEAGQGIKVDPDFIADAARSATARPEQRRDAVGSLSRA